MTLSGSDWPRVGRRHFVVRLTLGVKFPRQTVETVETLSALVPGPRQSRPPRCRYRVLASPGSNQFRSGEFALSVLLSVIDWQNSAVSFLLSEQRIILEVLVGLGARHHLLVHRGRSSIFPLIFVL